MAVRRYRILQLPFAVLPGVDAWLPVLLRRLPHHSSLLG